MRRYYFVFNHYLLALTPLEVLIQFFVRTFGIASYSSAQK